MGMAKSPPSFDFYFNDWIGGVQDLSAEDERHYLRLLIYQWQNGYIPKSKIVQMNVCGIVDTGRWDAIWMRIQHKFVPINDPNDDSNVIWVQMRMHKDRELAIPKWLCNVELREKRRAAGRLGGRPKSKTKANAKAKRKQNVPGGEGGRGNKEVKKRIVSLPFESDEYREAWDGYLEVRRAKKHTMTPRALGLVVAKLRGLGEAGGIAALNAATVGGWKSIYAPSQSAELAEQEAATRRRKKRLADTAREAAEAAARIATRLES